MLANQLAYTIITHLLRRKLTFKQASNYCAKMLLDWINKRTPSTYFLPKFRKPSKHVHTK